jgi:hypothetical protein
VEEEEEEEGEEEEKEEEKEKEEEFQFVSCDFVNKCETTCTRERSERSLSECR